MAQLIIGKVVGDTGPQGIQGVDGPQGQPGEQGVPGVDGSDASVTIANTLTETVAGKVLDATQGKILDVKIGPLASLLTRIKTSIINALNGVQEDLETHKADSVSNFALKANKAQETWISPTLINGWINFDVATTDSAGYFKDELGIVHLKGFVKGGATSSVCFVLPIGYKPLLNKEFPITYNGNFAFASILSDGSVGLYKVAGATYVCLESITFRVGV